MAIRLVVSGLNEVVRVTAIDDAKAWAVQGIITLGPGRGG